MRRTRTTPSRLAKAESEAFAEARKRYQAGELAAGRSPATPTAPIRRKAVDDSLRDTRPPEVTEDEKLLQFPPADAGDFTHTDTWRVLRIGGVSATTTYIAGISTALVSGNPVYVTANGQLGLQPSSARFKEEIRDMGDASHGLMKLRPVRFRYTPELDRSGAEQYGLIAEEVSKVAPDLVIYDERGEPQSVRYDSVNAMLLNEVPACGAGFRPRRKAARTSPAPRRSASGRRRRRRTAAPG
jgi:hypothetical protein